MSSKPKHSVDWKSEYCVFCFYEGKKTEAKVTKKTKPKPNQTKKKKIDSHLIGNENWLFGQA